ncbi:MAG TPA: arginine decarboxylase [Selenomonas sp.]|nr:arginine decarboxylase [Selenomonas sp.]
MMYSQKTAPIAQAMRSYAEDGALAFHTPGHKQGLGAHPMLRELITEKGLMEEVSLMEELDNLQAPSHCIRDAQRLAAELYGADSAWFMINGTTGAIHTMLLAALSPGDKVLVPRNAHRSMMGGILLAGAHPIFLQPEIEREYGIPMGLSIECVRHAIEAHPDAKAVAIVSPTYYGAASDTPGIAELAHSKGMLLLVDEAHGAHLRFSSKLPISAMEAGADLSAQSTHKLLGSLTQTSMLLGKKGYIDFDRVQTVSSLLQSTSPNYLLLASLDIARLQMAEEGSLRIERAIDIARKLREEIRRIPGLDCLGCECVGTNGTAGFDPTKLTVSVKGLGITGMEAETLLRHRFKLQCELSDPYNVMFIISMADTDREGERLLEGLKKLALHCEHNGKVSSKASLPPLELPAIPKLILSPREAFWEKTERVPMKASVGRICAEQLVFYPPGVPILCPGEEISPEILEYALERKIMGLKVTGVEDTSLKTIKVVL